MVISKRVWDERQNVFSILEWNGSGYYAGVRRGEDGMGCAVEVEVRLRQGGGRPPSTCLFARPHRSGAWPVAGGAGARSASRNSREQGLKTNDEGGTAPGLGVHYLFSHFLSLSLSLSLCFDTYFFFSFFPYCPLLFLEYGFYLHGFQALFMVVTRQHMWCLDSTTALYRQWANWSEESVLLLQPVKNTLCHQPTDVTTAAAWCHHCIVTAASPFTHRNTSRLRGYTWCAPHPTSRIHFTDNLIR